MQARQDSKGGRTPAISRGVVWGLLAAALMLIAMARAQWLRGDWLIEAWRRHQGWIALMAALQLAQSAVNVIRYRVMLTACGVRAGWRDAAAATLVSAGIALWLPASGGLSELLRIGLMCGADVHERDGFAARVALASLLDRAIGLIAVFVLGAMGAGALGVWGGGQAGRPAALGLAAALLLLGGLLLALLLGLARRARRWDTCRPFRMEAWPRLPRAARALATRLRSAAATSQKQHVSVRALCGPALLAFVLFVLLAWGHRLAIQTMGAHVNLAAVAAMLPLFTVAALLPVSFGGVGGQQLASILILALLKVLDPAVVASAGLLHAAVALAVQTLLAVLLAGISRRQLGRLLALRAGSSDSQTAVSKCAVRGNMSNSRTARSR